jgi:putative flippase GtrA
VAAVRAIPAFVRFVVFGGGVTLLGSGALLLLGDRVPVALGNAAVTVATTLLATELHTRFTFRRGRAGWSDHCASGLTVLLSYLFTTGALIGYDELRPGSGALLRQGVYLAASGAAGVARFLLLRYVFARPNRTSRTRGEGRRIVLPRPARSSTARTAGWVEWPLRTDRPAPALTRATAVIPGPAARAAGAPPAVALAQ